MNDPGSSRSLRPAPAEPGSARVDAKALLAAIQLLRIAPQDDAFWAEFARCSALLCRAQASVCLRFGEGGWQAIADWQATPTGLSGRWPGLAADLAERLGEKGFGTVPSGSGIPVIALGIRLPQAQSAILVLEIPESERPRLNELVLRAQLISDIPSDGGPSVSQHAGDALIRPTGAKLEDPAARGALLAWLDLVIQVTRHRQFGSASLALVNGIAAQTGWTQVSLGWRRGPYVRMRAISHLDRFERRADHVRLIESAMEETLDHDAAVHDPGSGEADAPVIAHARLRQGLGFGALLSMPLRGDDDATEAVLLLAHDDINPPPVPIEALELGLQMVMPWLAELELRNRWMGARAGHHIGRLAVEAVRINHIGRKLLAVSFAALLLYGIFGTWPHRIDANAELVTDSAQLLNSPFDSYMDQVLVTSGDTVRQGAVLAVLDRQELLLQESEIRAEIRRFTAESEKARAAGQTADVQISIARRAQAQARLERTLYQLEQARIVAPFDGVIVEGERRELLGSPVRRGDKVFRVAKVEGLYVTLYIPEADMRFITPESRGEISLLSQPDRNYPIRIEAVIPVAQVKPQAGNLFMVRARLLESPEAWWRPGMTGLARIDAGRQNILWLMTRRAIDALRLKLWW